MATAKKKVIVDQALSSKPAKAVTGLISSAVDAFVDPPLAPKIASPAKRSKRVSAKKAPAKAAKKMDRKLVSTMEDYEVKYLAQKHGVTQKAVKAAVTRVGHSRNKVEAELKRS